MAPLRCHTCDADDLQGNQICTFCGGTTFYDVSKQRASSSARRTPPTATDEHRQPLELAFNRAMRAERDLSEMLGLAKGMLADGVVNEAEAKFLYEWGCNHPATISEWPNNLIFSRLQQHFDDGRIEDDERAELQNLLTQLIGGTEQIVLGYDAATTLPLDAPPPLITWQRETYVFTGRFAYGTREQCAHEVLQRGGTVHEKITVATSFLVIGTFGSRDWRRSSYGRKIEQGVRYRDKGTGIRIVGEDHWANALNGVGAA